MTVLALALTFMQISGWQRSMKYKTSMHTSAWFQKIGMMEGWQCILVGLIEWVFYSVLFWFLFSFLEKRRTDSTERVLKRPRIFWLTVSAALMVIYTVYLVGCYPGFYNYDGGAQIVQVLYKEVPYNAHHPLLHTLIEGGIITLGYKIRGTDLTLGIFLYCLFQMGICAMSFAYSVRFIYQYTRKWFWALLAFIFYASCTPIIMFMMSTTKDVLCYAFLLVGILKLYQIYRNRLENAAVSKKTWIVTAVPFVLSCLLRNNIVYSFAVLAVISAVCHKRSFKGQLSFFAGIILAYFLINTCLAKGLNAAPGSVTEALSVPFQQIARLYVEKGEEAFNREELELLYGAIEPEMLSVYDPVIADSIKYAFWRHLDALKENKGAYIALWIKKGLQYPKVYLDSLLDNTYQAWYPGTVPKDRNGYRYFDITDWQQEYATPYIPKLYDFYQSVKYECSYQKYPLIRIFFSVGAMMWVTVITWFYGLWKKDRSISQSLLLALVLCVTFFAGPVSDVRYYLFLFYLFPVCVAFLGRGSTVNESR